MSSVLAGVDIAVIGGDDRELVLIPRLVQMGANVRVAGISKLSENKESQYFASLQDAVKGAGFVILPMPGIDEQGVIKAKYGEHPLLLDEETISCLNPDCTIIVGYARPLLKKLAAGSGIKIVEIAEMDEVAVLNSIPSAEGAIQLAMENTDITIHGSNVIVLGFGRCGVTLARMVSALGAKTTVAARKSVDLARIREMGLRPVHFKDLGEVLGEADIVFNTVPTVILDRQLLAKVKASVYICDIASAPGGVDFKAAGELGIHAALAPGLPGKVAPRTAGMILADIIPGIICSELTNTSSSSLNVTDGRWGCLK